MELAVSLTAVKTFPEVRLGKTEFAKMDLTIAKSEPSPEYFFRVP
jgi:hypothetical protein